MKPQNDVIPDEIARVIEQARRSRDDSLKQERDERDRARAEEEARGKAMWMEWAEKALQDVPKWIRPYCQDNPNADYSRIACGWDKAEKIPLLFEIPGLSLLAYNGKRWLSQRSGWYRYGDDDKPYLHFDDSLWTNDVESALLTAESEMNEYNAYRAEYEALIDERKRDAERERQIESKLETKRKERQERETAEDEALFNAVKGDPVALNLLRAFAFLRDERAAFERRLDEADGALFSTQENWARQTSELRRKADEIERRAAEEKYRLENELDDAKSELKKQKAG